MTCEGVGNACLDKLADYFSFYFIIYHCSLVLDMGGRSSKEVPVVYDEKDVSSSLLSAVVGLAPNPYTLAGFLNAMKTKDPSTIKGHAERVVKLEIQT